jgi:hypothetical protein
MSYSLCTLAGPAAAVIMTLSVPLAAATAQLRPHPASIPAATAGSAGQHSAGTVLAAATTASPGGVGWD